MRPAYARHRDVLKLIGSPTPERRWVLKYPAHMRDLRALLDVYPDACIVQTHRDPAQVLPSICSAWSRAGAASTRAAPTRRRSGAWQLDLYASMIEHAMDVRARSSPARSSSTLDFREVLADPVAAIERHLRPLRLRVDAGGRARGCAPGTPRNPQGKHGEHRYTPSSSAWTRARWASASRATRRASASRRSPPRRSERTGVSSGEASLGDRRWSLGSRSRCCWSASRSSSRSSWRWIRRPGRRPIRIGGGA